MDAGLDHLGKDLATTDAECPVRPDSDRGTGSGTSVDPANSNSSESGSNDTIEEGHRRTGYRPSVTGTPSLKRVNNSSLRSELHSIQPRVDGEDDVGGDGGGASRPEALEANWELLGDCLPTSMRTIDAKAAGVVSTMLDKLLATGWAPGQIRTILSAGGLPDRVFNLSGLVISRVLALPESPPAQVFGPPAPPPANGPPPEEEAPGSLEDLPREQWPAWYRAKREALEAGDPDGDRSYGWWVRNFRMKSPEDRDGEARRSTGKAHGPGDPGSVGVEHAGETSCGLSDYSGQVPWSGVGVLRLGG